MCFNLPLYFEDSVPVSNWQLAQKHPPFEVGQMSGRRGEYLRMLKRWSAYIRVFYLTAKLLYCIPPKLRVSVKQNTSGYHRRHKRRPLAIMLQVIPHHNRRFLDPTYNQGKSSQLTFSTTRGALQFKRNTYKGQPVMLLSTPQKLGHTADSGLN